MSSVAEAGANAGTRGRLLWVALALSLTLNIFFVAGLLWTRAAEPVSAFPERLARVADEINLSQHQRGAFQQLQREMLDRSQRLRDSNRPVFQSIWDELGAAQPDQARISQLVDEATENRRAYQMDVSAALGRFLAVLSPEQRAQFVELAKRPHNRQGLTPRH
ncbi:MAG TPA: periplasmic heavy metal sensor [Stellaceae bacterium]